MVPKDNQLFPIDEETIQSLIKSADNRGIEVSADGQKTKVINLNSLIPIITGDLVLLARNQVDIVFKVFDCLADIGGFIFIVHMIVNYFVSGINQRYMVSMIYKDAFKLRESPAFRARDPAFKKECHAFCCVLCNKEKRSNRYRLNTNRKRADIEELAPQEGGDVELQMFEGGSSKNSKVPLREPSLRGSVQASQGGLAARSLKQSARVPSATQA